MPTRLIREGILSSEHVALLGWREEVFYRRLLSVVDDYGLHSANPMLLLSKLYPVQLDKVQMVDINEMLTACEKARLVMLYQVDHKPFLLVWNFGQTPRSKPRFPLPDGWRLVEEVDNAGKKPKITKRIIPLENNCLANESKKKQEFSLENDCKQEETEENKGKQLLNVCVCEYVCGCDNNTEDEPEEKNQENLNKKSLSPTTDVFNIDGADAHTRTEEREYFNKADFHSWLKPICDANPCVAGLAYLPKDAEAAAKEAYKQGVRLSAEELQLLSRYYKVPFKAADEQKNWWRPIKAVRYFGSLHEVVQNAKQWASFWGIAWNGVKPKVAPIETKEPEQSHDSEDGDIQAFASKLFAETSKDLNLPTPRATGGYSPKSPKLL